MTPAHTQSNPTKAYAVPSVSVTYARNGASTRANALGMRPMQERVYEKRGEQYLLIKSPPASGKSRALMFVALDKLGNQGLQQAIIVVPEATIPRRAAARSRRWARSLTARAECWSAPMPPSALRWMPMGWRLLTTA